MIWAKGAIMGQRDLNPFLPVAPRFGTREEAQGFLSGLAGQHEVAHYTYLGVTIPGLNSSRSYFHSTYSAAWAMRYFDKNYERIDPVIGAALKGILPFDWQQCDRCDRIIGNFFGEAAEFGVKRQGLSIPIRGPSGERAVFSVNVDLPNTEWRDFKKEQMANLTMLAFYFHMAVMDLELGEKAAPPPLSPRETETLKWAAAGKSAWETGRILSISSRTVECYLRNAEVKLRATNKAQAVAIAMERDLLA